jgi:S1-C subfamily serine protease
VEEISLPAPNPRRRRRRGLSVLVAAAALGAVAFGVGGGLVIADGDSGRFPPAVPTTSAPAKLVTQRRLSPSDIATQVEPAVVDITATLGHQNAEAAGSGMVLTPSGEVLTNNHVIEGATSISVKISTGSKTYPATVVGTDRTDDIAVLQMQGASGLRTVALGNSSRTSVGDPVVAIGNAFNRPGPPAVTEGTITALGRSITVRDATGGDQPLSDLIETDARLVPGNSGGPLLDSAGQVVGMNTAASSGNVVGGGGNDGFATPVNNITPIVHQIESGRADAKVHVGPRGFLGVQLQGGSSSRSGGGLSPGGGRNQSGSGAVVAGVEANSPAAGAGLMSGDTIISIDGTTVTSSSSLADLIGAKRPGDTVKITWVDQSGRERSANARLTTGPA